MRVNFNDYVPLGQGGYGQSATPGKPGCLTANPDVDISTLSHEYDHFVTDRELGYPGMRETLQNPQLKIDGEIRFYNTEIVRARAEGKPELADALEAAKQKAVNDIKADYPSHFPGE